jgi:hypothetical protein
MGGLKFGKANWVFTMPVLQRPRSGFLTSSYGSFPSRAETDQLPMFTFEWDGN